jgi:hypothetical protein
MSIGCYYIIESTGSVTCPEESTLNGEGATIEVNGGSFHCTGRFNLGQGGDGYISLNGGTFTVDGTWKLPDDPGGVHRMWINEGIVHSGDIELRGERDAIVYVGGGVLRLNTVGTEFYDPYHWIAQGWLQPGEGYDEIVIEDKVSYTEISAVTLYPRVQFETASSSGAESSSPAELAVVLSEAVPNIVMVDYAVVGGTAEGGGVDYTLPGTGMLTFDPYQTSKTISIDIVDDGLAESDESIIVRLSNPVGAGTLLGKIAEHAYAILDARPGVGFETPASSGSEDVAAVDIPVHLSTALGESVTVDYAVTGGTATGGGVDYTLPGSGTLEFAPGVVTQYIPISVVDDKTREIPNETIELTLSNPSANVKLTIVNEHTYTIMNNDQGLRWNGLTWYYTSSPNPLRVSEFGALEWTPEKGGQAVTRLPEQRLSQAGDKVELTYLYMSDGKDDCPPDTCYNCIYCDDDITCIAGTSDFRFGLYEADGEYITADGFSVSNSVFDGYKGYNWRFGPHLQAYPTRWVDCTDEVHKTGNFAKKPVDRSDLMTINDGLKDYIPGFELPPGEWSLFTISLERLSSSRVRMSITLNDTTYTWTDTSSSGQPSKIDVFGFHMRNGRPYSILSLDTLWPQPATEPRPGNGADDVDPGVVLSWKAGAYVASHDVYLGTNFNDVNDGDTTSSVYRGRQDLDANSYDPPEPLESGGTYYWRVDEIFLVVDDAEDYCEGMECENLICDTWADGVINGTSSWVALGTTPYFPVHGGTHSIWFNYYNVWDYGAGYYSEISANTAGPNSLGIGKDWTMQEVKSLTLYFYGDPYNDGGASEQMYLGLEDSRGTDSYADVKYGDMNDVQEAGWHEWSIALQDFNDEGVNLRDVNRVCIGFGVRGSDEAGGNGAVCFDDIRLYPRRCIEPTHRADINADCVVEFKDFAILGSQWRQSPGSPSGDIGPELPDGVVDFRDLAVLAEGWLGDSLWPAE